MSRQEAERPDPSRPASLGGDEHALLRRALFEQSHDGIAIIGQDHRIIEANARFAEMLGYSPEEVVGLLTWDYEARLSEAEVRRAFANLPDIRSTFESRHRRKDGSVHDVEVSATGALVAGQSVVIAICRDISARKEAERARQASEERFRALFERTSQGIVYQAADGSIVDANPAAERILGLTRDEILGRTSVDPRWRAVRDDGSDLPGADHPAMIALRTGRRVDDVLMGIEDPRAGKRRWILVDAVPEFREGETVPCRVFTSFLDVTAREEAGVALRDSEARLRTFVEHAPASIVMLDRDMRYLAASRRWLRDFRLEVDDIVGRSHYDLFPEIPERWKAVHRRCLAGATESCAEDPFVRGDGHVDWISWQVTPWRDGSGAVGGIVISSEAITERKVAELHLRESEAQKRAILDSVAAQVCLLDERGTIVEVNEPWREFGRENGGGADVGTSYLDVCDRAAGAGSESAERTAAGIRAVLDGRLTAFTLEYPCPSPSATHWFTLTVTPLGGERRGAVVAHSEISERKRAETVVEMQNRVLASVASGAPLASTLDLLARLVEEIEPEMVSSILLLDPDGLRLRHGAGPRLPDAYTRAIDGVRIGEGVGSCGTAAWRRRPVVVRDVSTDPLWKDFRGLALEHGLRACWSTPVLGTDGALLGTFAVYYRTARTPTGPHELLVERATSVAAIAIARDREVQTLRASEQRFHDIVEASADWVWEVDDAGVYTYASESVRDLLGYEPREILGKTPFDLMPPAEAARVAAEFGAIAAERRAFRDLDNAVVAKDGSIRHVQTNGMPILGPDGELLGYRGLDRDVTERKRAEEARERLQAQLQQAQKMEAVGRLAGGVAHDFNNMLGIIVGRADMALQRPGLDERARRDLGEVLEAARKSADLTRQLLAFARRQTVRPAVLDLNDSVEGTLGMLRRLIGEDMELTFVPGPDLWSVKIDPSQVDQALANLVVNARDAIQGPGRIALDTANVELGASFCESRPWATPGRYVRLTVADSGHGMDEATLAHVFEPFFTTKPEGQGTGLGLATVYGIVKQNGGLIEVESRPGDGASFRLYFPRVDEASSRRSTGATGHLARGTETVLVAEDEEALLAVVRESLQTLGYRVLSALGGKNAVEVAAAYQGEIHLLLTDVVMPDLNGREVAERLRAARPGLRCLFMSGYTADVIARRGVLEEGVHFLPKPCTRADLARRVREALDA